MIESDTTEFAFLVGRSIGRYKLESLLGRGAMAEVYKSTHPELGRDIAVKILHPFHTQVPGFIGRFRLEAKAAASLHHPNIVQVYDFSVSKQGLYYMVMQYINGLSLEEYLSLERSPLSLTKTFFFFRQIADALAFAHQQGTIHRDVKPGNILLDTRENAYLADFGLAKLMDVEHQTLSGIGLGTPAYMAPEQISGQPVTAAVDIYAMGVILYRMLTNQLPYDGDSLMEIINRKLNNPPPPPREFNPDLPASVEELILKAISREPKDRYPDVDTLANVLEDTLIAELGEIPDSALTTTVGVVPLPSLQLDNYKVKREFSRDSTGISRRYYQRYLAHNTALGMMAVLTVFKTSADEKSNFVQKLHSRMDKLSLLDHPGIAAISRVDKTPSNQPYVAYEFIPGESLETKITAWHRKAEPVDPVTVLQLMKQTAAALAVAHDADLIHNDLRPENIIIREDNGVPVLVGLEIPLAPDSQGVQESLAMIDYASPEQLAGESLTKASNIYSFGVVLYKMLVGQRPAINWERLGDGKPLEGVPLSDVRYDLSPVTYRLVQDCLQPVAEERPNSVAAFTAYVEEAIAAETAAAQHATRWQRRRRWAYTALSVVVIGVLAFLLGFAVLRNDATNAASEESGTPVLDAASDESATPTPTETVSTNVDVIDVNTTPFSTPTRDENLINTAVNGSDTSTPTVTVFDMLPNGPTSTATFLPKVTADACSKPEDWVSYTIEDGDTLFVLATNTGVSVSDLQLINCLRTTVLSVGQEIWLPTLPPTATPTMTNTPTPTTSFQRPPATRRPTNTPPPPPVSSTPSSDS